MVLILYRNTTKSTLILHGITHKYFLFSSPSVERRIKLIFVEYPISLFYWFSQLFVIPLFNKFHLINFIHNLPIE